MPTEKAHGIQIAKTCEAFGKRAPLDLLLPKRRNSLSGSLFAYFNIQKSFSTQKLRCLDLISAAAWLGPLAYLIEVTTFAWSVAAFLKKQSTSEAVIYTRDLYTLLFLPAHYSIVYEVHTLPKKMNIVSRRLLKKADHIVVITKYLKDDLIHQGMPAEKIMVAPDGVDEDALHFSETRTACREIARLPHEKSIALYAGHLYAWKGADTVLAAAARAPECLFVFVGGKEDDRETFRRQCKEKNITNVRFVEHQKHERVLYYLHAADVLLLPNSASLRISSHYTSPMKLFEYMASGVPIVASDLPSLREVLSEKNAQFFSPDNADALADAVRTVLVRSDRGSALAEQAKKDVQQYTWDQRAKHILAWISE